MGAIFGGAAVVAIVYVFIGHPIATGVKKAEHKIVHVFKHEKKGQK